MNQDLKKGFRPLKKRLRFLRMLQGIFWGTLTAVGWIFLLLLLSFFVPIAKLNGLCLWGSLWILLLAVFLGFFWKLDDKTAAKRADRCNLQERLQAALEFSGDSPMEQLLREDALKSLQSLDLKTALPVSFPGKRAIAAGILFVLCIPLFFLENPQDKILEEREAFLQRVEEAVEKIEEKVPEIEEALFAEESKEELRKIMDELAKGLENSEDAREGLTELAKTEQRLEELLRKEALHALSGALSENGMSGLSEEIGRTMEGLESMEALQASLLAASENQELDPMLQEMLGQASEALYEGDLEGLEAAALALSASSAASSVSGDLSALMESLREGISASANAGTGGEASGMAGSGSGGEGKGSGSASGSGNGEGNSLGSGSGAGTGSTNQEAGSPASSSGSSGQNEATASYKEGVYETIYDPSRLGLEGEKTQISGLDEDAEHVQVELGTGAGDTSGTVPYREVIGEYSEAAARDAGDPDLPDYVRDWVDGYFNALTE